MILLVLFWPKIIVFCEYKQKGKSRGLIKEDETGVAMGPKLDDTAGA